jgi:hypothetical protein
MEGMNPVVRDIIDNGQAGTAVGAVDERIAVTAVPGIKELSEAVRTGGCVGGDVDRSLPPPLVDTRDDTKDLLPTGSHFFAFPTGDPGQWGKIGRHFVRKTIHYIPWPFDLDQNPIMTVLDPASKASLCSETIKKGAKTDALNDAEKAVTPAPNHLPEKAPICSFNHWLQISRPAPGELIRFTTKTFFSLKSVLLSAARRSLATSTFFTTVILVRIFPQIFLFT